MAQLRDLSMAELLSDTGYVCSCGRTHRAGLQVLKIGSGAVDFLPEALATLACKRPFVICDGNTWQAAGDRVDGVLAQAGIAYVRFQFQQAHVEPDEHANAQLEEALEPGCDVVVSVGSGVLTDCAKVLAQAKGLKHIAVATAPSMDGYASNSSSMIYHRVKVSAYNACPQAILADTDILKKAPERMLRAGLGDMLAKSVAQCEWRISNIVTGEYYCEEIAGLMRKSLQKITQAAPKLLERDEAAVEAVAEGLVLSGLAMAFAEISRPASGLEHYFSHLWEMFALQADETPELHGIQVGVGTALTLKILQQLRAMQPDEKTARQAMEAFDEKAWETGMRAVFGTTAQELITKENTLWCKNDPQARMARFARIAEHWDAITTIMDEELPDADETIGLMRSLGLPTTPEEIDITQQQTRDAFLHSRDIRDKYLTSSMLWDMGLLDEFVAK